MRALHHWVVGQVPLLPLTTSRSEAAREYGTELACTPAPTPPASAKTDAMIGEDTLVPPTCAQVEAFELVG